MLDAMGAEGGVRALLVFGSNLAVSAPRAGHIEKRLDALDFLMVSDFFLSETAERADVVLPSAQWAEEEGTMTNLEGRVILRQRAMPPPDGVRTDLEVLSALARTAGIRTILSLASPLRFSKNCGAHRRAEWPIIPASLRNASGAKTGSSGRAPAKTIPARRVCFWSAFATADGRARFHPVEFQPPAEEPDDEFPLYLTTGRIMAQYQSGTQTRRIAALMKSVARSFRADSSFDGADVWDRGRRSGAPDHAPRHGTAGRATDALHSHGYAVRSVSLRRNRTRQSADQSGAGSGFADARIQSLRSTHRERNSRARETSIHTGTVCIRGPRPWHTPVSFSSAAMYYRCRPTSERRRSISGQAMPSPEMIYLVLTRRRTRPCAISRWARRARSTCRWR